MVPLEKARDVDLLGMPAKHETGPGPGPSKAGSFNTVQDFATASEQGFHTADEADLASQRSKRIEILQLAEATVKNESYHRKSLHSMVKAHGECDSEEGKINAQTSVVQEAQKQENGVEEEDGVKEEDDGVKEEKIVKEENGVDRTPNAVAVDLDLGAEDLMALDENEFEELAAAVISPKVKHRVQQLASTTKLGFLTLKELVAMQEKYAGRLHGVGKLADGALPGQDEQQDDVMSTADTIESDVIGKSERTLVPKDLAPLQYNFNLLRELGRLQPLKIKRGEKLKPGRIASRIFDKVDLNTFYRANLESDLAPVKKVFQERGLDVLPEPKDKESEVPRPQSAVAPRPTRSSSEQTIRLSSSSCKSPANKATHAAAARANKGVKSSKQVQASPMLLKRCP